MNYAIETAREMFTGIENTEAFCTDDFEDVIKALKKKKEQGYKVINLYYRETDSYDSGEIIKVKRKG